MLTMIYKGAVLQLCAALFVLLAATRALAAGEIESIDPPSISQGDTVMLSIRGRELPQGSPVLEFYPQQIAVLSLLSVKENEIIAQIKVPNLAAPGLYNILIYNQSGDEVFAKGLLTVASNVLTPVFKDYDPKAIAQADSGFALILSSDGVSAEAVSHLTMSWELSGERVSGLKSSFSALDATTVVCAVTGKAPGGTLRGTVRLDDKPIYLVEVTVMSESGVVVGHAPAALQAGKPPYVFKLLGAQFSPDYASRLRVRLNVNGQFLDATKVTLRDASSIAVQFDQNLPLGSMVLNVEEDGVVVYEGQLEVSDAPAPTEPREPPQELPDILNIPPADAQLGGGELPPASGGGTLGALAIAAVDPQVFKPSAESQKYSISVAGGSENLLGRLDPALLVDGVAAPVLFKGIVGSSITCIFATLPQPQPALECVLQVSDTQGEYSPYRRTLSIEGAPLLLETPASPAEPLELPPLEPNTTAAGNAAESELASPKIEIDANGFRIQLLGAQGISDSQALGAVKTTSGLLLLDRNLDKFSVHVFREAEGSPIATLEYRRDPALLSDELYELFMEQLRSETEVPLRLQWDGLGIAVEELVSFVSSEELVFEDLMQNISGGEGG